MTYLGVSVLPELWNSSLESGGLTSAYETNALPTCLPEPASCQQLAREKWSL